MLGKDRDLAKMKWPLAFVVGAVGLVWLGQGTGLLGGSVMSGEPLWAGIGGAMVLGVIVLITTSRRHS
jgi:hypothetical protein